MTTNYYINKTKKLHKGLDKYLTGLKGSLIDEYGSERAQSIIENSKTYYPEIILKIPYFNMKVSTRNCQMVQFMVSVGEEDLIPYCSFADFANAESMGLGLKQTSTIDSGVYSFCFSKKGEDPLWNT